MNFQPLVVASLSHGTFGPQFVDIRKPKRFFNQIKRSRKKILWQRHNEIYLSREMFMNKQHQSSTSS